MQDIAGRHRTRVSSWKRVRAAKRMQSQIGCDKQETGIMEVPVPGKQVCVSIADYVQCLGGICTSFYVRLEEKCEVPQVLHSC